MTTPDPVARLGARVGAWCLESLLGTGGIGAVYRARHPNGDLVALKILHPERAADRAWIARLSREARLARMVDHPAVVRVLGEGRTEDGSPYLVSELVDGETLEDARLEGGGRLPLDEVVAVADVLLDVLASAHAKGVIHRDIKPENLMRTEAGALRVLDFGLARDLAQAGDPLTSVNAVVGTIGFMAPEQAQGRSDLVDARTDLWAAAATLLKLATGLDVHEGLTAQTRLALVATAPVPPLGPRCPELPVRFAAALDRALAFSREDRFPTAASFRAAVLGLSDAPTSASHDAVAPPGRARRRRSGAAALAVLAIGLAALGAVRARRASPPTAVTSSPALVASESASAPAPSTSSSSLEEATAAASPPSATPRRAGRPAHKPRAMSKTTPASPPDVGAAAAAAESVRTAPPAPSTVVPAGDVLDRRR